MARPALGLASRRAFRRTPTPTTIVRANLSTGIRQLNPLVSVVSYSDGERMQEGIEAKPEGTGPVMPPGNDLQKTANPLNASVYSQLSPTLFKFTLQDKVAVVTGQVNTFGLRLMIELTTKNRAGRGLGFNMAQSVAEVGVRGIAILDVQQEIGDQAARDLSEQTGVDVRFYRVDVRDGVSIGHTIQDVVDHFGEVNVLINAASIADSNIKAETYDLDKFRRLIDINVTGTFITTQACAQQMIKARTGGSIINIASMSGSVVNFPQEQCSYNASKAAVIQLTKSLAAEWARHGIRVNSISPGYMDTALNRVPGLEAQKKI
ncbi:hypothetical protein LTR37_005824 [Vermiconidia calcicola]|uniref:Uncharacterized protein n=1 Tax=Vermiconidia calcicola TaxID=1690605 RepID=A0ACC3NJH5_9PEZI|nr:hypothetical protein LTR37_005824 [Vermiconidia calcicola]